MFGNSMELVEECSLQGIVFSSTILRICMGTELKQTRDGGRVASHEQGREIPSTGALPVLLQCR